MRRKHGYSSPDQLTAAFCLFVPRFYDPLFGPGPALCRGHRHCVGL